MSGAINSQSDHWVSDPTIPNPENLTSDHDEWRTVTRELKFDGDYAKVFLEKVLTPTRPEGITWTVVRRKGAIAVAPRTVEGKWLLVRQERIPIRQAIWEFPAGQIEGSAGPGDATVRQSVWRELREETGYTASPESHLTPLDVFFSSPGFTDEHSYLFLADALIPHPDGAAPDEAESILTCEAFTSEDLREKIASGEIRDANTLALFARLAARNLL